MAKELKFQYVIDTINANYDFSPTPFRVFPGALLNAAGTNEGACRVLAFAKDQSIDSQKDVVLELFAEHYDAVLANPNGAKHQNIRLVMQHGAEEVEFSCWPLSKKKEFDDAEISQLIEAARVHARQRRK